MKSRFKNTGLIFKIFLGFGLLTFNFGLLTSVHAQTLPEFLVSWRASDYVPADYRGKVLPSKSSAVEIGFDVIDANKLADLSRNNISWYLDDTRFDAGIGHKTTTLNIPSGLSQRVRMTVANYKGGNNLDFEFLIPVSNPVIVINTKTPTVTANNQRFLPVQSYMLEARPFFFNVNTLGDLSFKWQVNDNKVEGGAGNPELLSLDLQAQGTPKESQFTISASASSKANQLEFAGKQLNFIVK